MADFSQFSSFLPQLIPPNKRREAGGKLEDLLAPDITKLLTPQPGAQENISRGIQGPIEALLQKVGLGSSGGAFDIGSGAVGGPTGRGTPGIVPPPGGGGGGGGLSGLLSKLPLLLAAKNNPAIAGGFTRQGNIASQQGLEQRRILAGELASRRGAETTRRGQDVTAGTAAEAEAGRTSRFETEQATDAADFKARLRHERALINQETRNRRSEIKQADELRQKTLSASNEQTNKFAIERIKLQKEFAESPSMIEIIDSLSSFKDPLTGAFPEELLDLALLGHPEAAKIKTAMADINDANVTATFSKEIMSLFLAADPPNEEAVDELRRRIFEADLPEESKLLKMIDDNMDDLQSTVTQDPNLAGVLAPAFQLPGLSAEAQSGVAASKEAGSTRNRENLERAAKILRSLQGIN